MTIKQQLCEKLKMHNWAIDASSTRDAEKNERLGIYKIYICTKCGLRHEIMKDRRYFYS